jgi:hypothetical protein
MCLDTGTMLGWYNRRQSGNNAVVVLKARHCYYQLILVEAYLEDDDLQGTSPRVELSLEYSKHLPLALSPVG